MLIRYTHIQISLVHSSFEINDHKVVTKWTHTLRNVKLRKSCKILILNAQIRVWNGSNAAASTPDLTTHRRPNRRWADPQRRVQSRRSVWWRWRSILYGRLGRRPRPERSKSHRGELRPEINHASFLSAAEGQRPSNYSSCCYSCCCSWIFRLIYALSTYTTVLPPIFLNILNLSIYQSINLSIYPSSSIFSVNLSINLFHSLNINI